jgi:hypothetical protein
MVPTAKKSIRVPEQKTESSLRQCQKCMPHFRSYLEALSETFPTVFQKGMTPENLTEAQLLVDIDPPSNVEQQLCLR